LEPFRISWKSWQAVQRDDVGTLGAIERDIETLAPAEPRQIIFDRAIPPHSAR
jgi:hypothetical protein